SSVRRRSRWFETLPRRSRACRRRRSGPKLMNWAGFPPRSAIRSRVVSLQLPRRRAGGTDLTAMSAALITRLVLSQLYWASTARISRLGPTLCLGKEPGKSRPLDEVADGHRPLLGDQ